MVAKKIKFGDAAKYVTIPYFISLSRVKLENRLMIMTI